MTVTETSREVRLQVEEVASPTLLKQRTVAPWLLIFGFLGSLILLAFGTFVREQPPFEEDRARYAYPPVPTRRYEFEDYPKWAEMALQDRLGYRDVLLQANRQIHHQLFGEPPSAFAWIGRDGWLYLNVSDPNRGHDDKPTLDERLSRWAEAYAERAKWCRNNGMEFVVLLAPEKSSVYPEFLTEQQRRSLPAVEVTTRMKELLRTRGVRCIDPLPELLEAKSRNVVYHQNDTHWNQAGAQVAHCALMKELGTTPSDDYSVDMQTYTGDLNRLTGTSQTCSAPHYTHRHHTSTWNFEHPSRELLPNEAKPKHLLPRVTTNPEASGPSLVLLHDSFGEAMFDFLSHDCRSVATAASDTLQPEFILAHRPRVVVQEIVSRKLYRWVPDQTPAISPSR